MMDGEPVDAEAFRAFERNVHDRMAAGYADFFAPATARAAAPLLAAVAAISGCRLLDVACGPGVVAAAAIRLGAKVNAVDLSPAMVAEARRRVPGLDVEIASADALPFPDGTFDAVTMSFGVGHMPDPDAALAEAMRVLKPGGRLALSWWDGPERSRLNGTFLDAMAEAGVTAPAGLIPPGPAIFRFSSDPALRDLLAAVGLDDISVQTHAGTHEVPDAGTFWDGGLTSLARVSTVLLALDEADRVRVRQTFDRLTAGYQQGGVLAVPYAFKIVSGKIASGALVPRRG